MPDSEQTTGVSPTRPLISNDVSAAAVHLYLMILRLLALSFNWIFILRIVLGTF